MAEERLSLSSDVLQRLGLGELAVRERAGDEDLLDAILAVIRTNNRLDNSGDDECEGEQGIANSTYVAASAAAAAAAELEDAESSEDEYVPVNHKEYYKKLFPERYLDEDDAVAEVGAVACSTDDFERVVLLSMDDEYVQRLLMKAISHRSNFRAITEYPEDGKLDLHWGEYEHIDWFNERGSTNLSVKSCYYNRKGLIRKGNLAYTLEKWQAKYRDSRKPLAPKSFVLTLPNNCDVSRDATFNAGFDEAYAACGFPGFGDGDLVESRAHDANTDDGNVWILKPSMTNQADGISLVRSRRQLTEAVRRSDPVQRAGDFVLQRYLPPLLLDGRKFHLRVFMLLVGNIVAYVAPDFLAIFSLEQYNGAELDETRAHLTNIAHQEVLSEADQHRCMRRFAETAPDMVAAGVAASLDAAEAKIKLVQERVMTICAETVEAVCGELTFQPRSNCFELFGLDLMIDPEWNVWLLEANAEPDLSKAGDRLQPVIDKVLEDSLSLVIRHNKSLSVATTSQHEEDDVTMIQVFRRNRAF